MFAREQPTAPPSMPIIHPTASRIAAMKWFSRLCLVAALALFGPVAANAVSQGAPNPDLFAACNASAQYDASTSGRTILVTHSANSAIYPCGYDILGSAGG